MRLLLRRDQRQAGMLGNKILFSLDVRADLSAEEKQRVERYRLSNSVLYANADIVPGSGVVGFATGLALKASILTVTVDDLVRGKRIECGDILEMLGAEEQIKDAARTFVAMLDASATFGGEEVVEL